MRIRIVNAIAAEQLHKEAAKGARFVHYSYSISLLIATLRRKSGIYMIKPGENAVKRGIPFIILTILFGWWGVPNGPKFSLESLRTNLKGGKDVTDEITALVEGHLLFHEAQKKKLQVDSNT